MNWVDYDNDIQNKGDDIDNGDEHIVENKAQRDDGTVENNLENHDVIDDGIIIGNDIIDVEPSFNVVIKIDIYNQYRGFGGNIVGIKDE